jgi:hypothetical protein
MAASRRSMLKTDNNRKKAHYILITGKKITLSSYSDGLLNIQIAEENKAPNSLMFLSRTKKSKSKHTV